MPLPEIGPATTVGTSGVPVTWPFASVPGAGVQVPAAVPSVVSHIAMTREYSCARLVVGVEGTGRPIGRTSPSARTFTIFDSSPTNIHGSSERRGRAGRSASGWPEKPEATGMVAPVAPRCTDVSIPQMRVMVCAPGSRSLRTEWAVVPVPWVAPAVWPGRAVASPSSWCQMLVSRAHPSIASSESLRFSVPRPKRTMCVSNGFSNGALVTLFERREICSDIDLAPTAEDDRRRHFRQLVAPLAVVGPLDIEQPPDLAQEVAERGVLHRRGELLGERERRASAGNGGGDADVEQLDDASGGRRRTQPQGERRLIKIDIAERQPRRDFPPGRSEVGLEAVDRAERRALLRRAVTPDDRGGGEPVGRQEDGGGERRDVDLGAGDGEMRVARERAHRAVDAVEDFRSSPDETGPGVAAVGRLDEDGLQFAEEIAIDHCPPPVSWLENCVATPCS